MIKFDNNKSKFMIIHLNMNNNSKNEYDQDK